MSAAGATLTSAGVVPTPAIAYVTRAMAFDAGIVISASHNPFQDNGIKVFSGTGEKFTEPLEREVESIVAARDWEVPGDAVPRIEHANVIDAYIAMLAWRCRRPSVSARSSSRSTPPTARPRPSRRGCSASWGSTCR